MGVAAGAAVGYGHTSSAAVLVLFILPKKGAKVHPNSAPSTYVLFAKMRIS